ncbi:hypothetical protein FRACYDRAFT_272276 [Fragilariopsis cylindrus CCMP1102]|uniref:RING-type domain-containing protein n=1 Tax=Fragilariopsis cylindrus CCMP1102 TaxID=635003 RepID=A0A1E7EM25_9STRA|nr:hypothetical protein FRACYDRAFT_272276 [Fragilariopsis cylindrus CCMP1102]|eukprot:OEU06982.1 hypothetical protein FRACYDRAFT_272276 [Fragilariopsis cylindrus CCMP1102]
MNNSTTIMNNTTSESYDVSTSHEMNNTWAIFISITALCSLMIFLILLCIDNQRLKMVAIRVANEANSEDRTANLLGKMSLKQRKEVYEQAFLSNGNYITLTDSHLFESENKEIGKNCRSCEFVDIELGDDDEIASKSVYLIFEKQRYNDTAHCNTDDSACNKQKQQQVVTTNDISCVICFEDFSVDDIIVWSENNECPHFYHKECMIDYLSLKRRQKEVITNTNPREDQSNDHSADTSRPERTIDDEHITIIEDNPCPTCRRNFCSITTEGLNLNLVNGN